ncbi:MAG TPA: hypothetical protein VMT96_00295 [Candidatus Bathyarchaeia archaeon]|nr:hypothetical protein [Candidatus Bathyarchaeia archaeon]
MGKTAKLPEFNGLTRRQKAIILPVFIIVGTAAVVLAVTAIILAPKADLGSRNGVGADGFQAYVEKGTNLGVGNTVTKDEVIAALGDKAKSVGNADVSNVFYYNGDRKQTLSFDFTRADGSLASLYIDLTVFKSSASLNQQHIYVGTGKANPINGLAAYYRIAQTIGSDREYQLMVVNGTKVYRFVIDQPVENITINEVSAVASLIKLAQKANL